MTKENEKQEENIGQQVMDEPLTVALNKIMVAVRRAEVAAEASRGYALTAKAAAGDAGKAAQDGLCRELGYLNPRLAAAQKDASEGIALAKQAQAASDLNSWLCRGRQRSGANAEMQAIGMQAPQRAQNG